MTKNAKYILEIINASDEHLTAEQIFLCLKEKNAKAVLATVYNNVNKLVQSGKVAKLSIEGQIDRYDKTLKHDHLICSVCGKISDYSFSDLTAKLEEELGEVIEGYDLRIRYVCPDCRK